METTKEKINGNAFLLRSWKVEEPKANVLIVHGYAEHSGRYEETARHLNNAGISVYAFDRRGEGASGGKRAEVNNFSQQVTDLQSILQKIEKGKVPLFLYGHSLGGLISVTYILEQQNHDVDGLLLSGPLLMPDEDMSPFIQKISGFVGRVLPFLPVVKVDTKLVTRSIPERKAYDEDPLVYHGSTKAKTAFEILKAMKRAQKRFSEITLPFLVMHGTSDKLANPKGSKLLFEKASSEDKSLELMQGQFHELMREPEKADFFKLITSWILDRV